MAEVDQRAAILMKRFGSLKQYRSNWESHWQEIGDFVAPNKGNITKKRTPGDKNSERIFDGTAQFAAELMASSMHGMLTNSGTPWFSLRYTDDEFETDDVSKEWLERATDVMYVEIGRSNFHEAIHELYSDLVTFGTGVMFVDTDKEGTLRFSTRHISECYVSEDEFGRVDTVFREFKIAARAAVSQFGEENVSQKILKKSQDDPYDMIELLHIVMPRYERDTVKIDAKNKPIASIYLDPDSKKIISESGFDEFPYMVPRFRKSSYENGYGRSPAMTALADIKMVNEMSKAVIQAAQLQIHPPLLVPDDGFILPVRTVPGGLNFYRSGTRDRIEPLNIGANNPVGENQLEQRRTAIRAAFYVDQLITGNRPGMTATEVIQKSSEKMRILAPLTGRLQSELLRPLIDRIFNLISRKKGFEVAPDTMGGNEIDIEYVSPLAKAQRQGDIQASLELFQFLAPLMQVDPNVVDYLDVDGLAKHIIKTTGVPASVVRGEDEVASLREAKQAAQEQMAAAQQQAMLAKAAGEAAPGIRAVDDVSPETQEAVLDIVGGGQ
ncbi:MAG: putative portal protein [Prokaryotic dsDNA virus sp.]|nr:MAG: putative portal protein [Prokaryotic dsDNA virus sp.]|tara:strand:- start:2846 stop:4504 length:1659 start_codon:yes stop_codon:yes gene_type:complete